MGQLAALATFVFLTASSAWAQTTAPGGTGAPAGGTGTGGGIGDYWWVILLILVVAVAIWYFTRNRSNRTGV
jgi:hypothetical protein